MVQQIQILRPGSNKIPVMLQNLSCQAVKLKKGVKVAHMMAGNVVPPMLTPKMDENIPERDAVNTPKSNLPRNPPENDDNRLKKCFINLDLSGIVSWTEKQQQSVRDLLLEYQHLFAMNLSELGMTSLVQHDIKLDNPALFKEHYHRIPPHQHDEVKKHLQEMMEIRAICKSTSL